MSSPPSPADSATVIVLRASTRGPCEVLLVERHAQSRAFAGASVFPGGVVDAADTDPRLLAASPALDPGAARLRLGEAVAAETALSFWIAAIRELFEETGILLASRPDAPFRSGDDPARVWMATRRQALLAGELTFGDMVADGGLVLQTGALHYFSRWITPKMAPRRYDARFFVARLPDGQEPLHDDRETIATVWIRPADAIARAQAGSLTLAPPTLRTLDELEDYASVDEIFAATRDRTVAPITPRMTTVEGNPAVIYPGDADYDLLDESAPPTAAGAPAPGRAYDRMLMVDGVWRAMRTRAPR